LRAAKTLVSRRREGFAGEGNEEGEIDMPMVNWLAVIAAALSMFVIGGIWYSPVLFDKAWRRAANLSDEDVARGNPAVIFGVAFILTLVMAANLIQRWALPSAPQSPPASAGRRSASASSPSSSAGRSAIS
jgi:hypothetical protein